MYPHRGRGWDVPPGPPAQGQGRGWAHRPTDEWASMRQNRGGYQADQHPGNSNYQPPYQHQFGMQQGPHGPSPQRPAPDAPIPAASQPSSDDVDSRRARDMQQNSGAVGSPEEGQILEEGQLLESPCRPKSTENEHGSMQLGTQHENPATPGGGDVPQHSVVSTTIHSPLSPANHESTAEIRNLDADHESSCPEDRAKKPRLKFGGGLVSCVQIDAATMPLRRGQ
jgi:hypothetical protein